MSRTPFGKFIRDRRNEVGLTLEELSKAIGVSVPYLSEIEKGGRKPFAINKDDAYVRLATALKMDRGQIEEAALLERGELPEKVADSDDLREVALSLYRRSNQPKAVPLTAKELAKIKQLLEGNPT